MKDSMAAFLTGFVLGSLMIVILLSYVPMHKWAIEEAVKQGHAEYYLNANNERDWRWKGDK